MKLEEEIHQKKFRNEHHRLAVNLIFTGNWVKNSHIRFLKTFGLSLQQFNILRILRGQHPQPASINLLMERMLDKMSNASRLVDKLKKKGYVERKDSPKDRRQADVVITTSGMELLAEIDDKMDALEKILTTLSPQEIKTLNDLLDKVRG